MATKLIELQDGILIGVEIPEQQAQKIAGGSVPPKVDASIEAIEPLLMKVCRPVVNAWQKLRDETEIEQAEIELGLSFEGSGKLFVATAKASANITVKLTLKPKNPAK